LPQRLDAVLEAIYAAFGIGWDDMVGVDQRGRDLAEEAIWLARVLLQLMPGEAEVRGLLALMLHCEARRTARRGHDGRYVPLSEQDTKQWSLPLIDEAERHLAEAFKHGHPGRFQLEAAIQSVHAERARSGRIESNAIARFYEQLLCVSPTLGTRTRYAAAIAEANGPEAGLLALARAPISKIEAFKKRMGWRFNWVSSCGTDFNCDYRASFTQDEMARGKVEYNFDLVGFPSAEAPGISVFYKDETGTIFRTYSA